MALFQDVVEENANNFINMRDADPVTFGVSCHWHSFPEKPQWVSGKGLAIEYSPNPQQLDDITAHLDPLKEEGIPLRYHAFFPGFEIGDLDYEQSERAMELHLQFFDRIRGSHQKTVTVHIGLNPKAPINHDRVISNLTRLVAYGKARGITVCVENLKRGAASIPENVLRWADGSGANITLDVGHAVSCELVARGEMRAAQIADMFGDRIHEIHLYGYETDTHHPPEDMSLIGPVIDRVLETGCRWWTIELNDYQEIEHTLSMVSHYVAEKQLYIAA